jgi:hypothetical protein
VWRYSSLKSKEFFLRHIDLQQPDREFGFLESNLITPGFTKVFEYENKFLSWNEVYTGDLLNNNPRDLLYGIPRGPFLINTYTINTDYI